MLGHQFIIASATLSKKLIQALLCGATLALLCQKSSCFFLSALLECFGIDARFQIFLFVLRLAPIPEIHMQSLPSCFLNRIPVLNWRKS